MASRNLRSWVEPYQLVKDYRLQHGKLPSGKGAQYTLSNWLSRQRIVHRKGLLSPERVALLDKLGIDWNPVGGPATHRYWVRKLVKYQKKHGHTNVPQLQKEQNPELQGLAKWVAAARVRYKYGRTPSRGPLPKEIIKRLNKLGFEWDLRRDKRWRELCDLAAQFFAEYPEGGPVTDAAARGKYGRDFKIWLGRQRRHYQSGKLSGPRIEELEALGMIWAGHKPESPEARAERWARQMLALLDCDNPFSFKVTDAAERRFLNNGLAKYLRGRETLPKTLLPFDFERLLTLALLPELTLSAALVEVRCRKAIEMTSDEAVSQLCSTDEVPRYQDMLDWLKSQGARSAAAHPYWGPRFRQLSVVTGSWVKWCVQEAIKSKLKWAQFRVECEVRAAAQAPRYTDPDNDLPRLDLSVRSFNTLRRSDIFSVKRLCEFSADELLRMPGFGVKTIYDIKQALDREGQSLAA